MHLPFFYGGARGGEEGACSNTWTSLLLFLNFYWRKTYKDIQFCVGRWQICKWNWLLEILRCPLSSKLGKADMYKRVGLPFWNVILKWIYSTLKSYDVFTIAFILNFYCFLSFFSFKKYIFNGHRQLWPLKCWRLLFYTSQIFLCTYNFQYNFKRCAQNI